MNMYYSSSGRSTSWTPCRRAWREKCRRAFDDISEMKVWTSVKGEWTRILQFVAILSTMVICSRAVFPLCAARTWPNKESET